MTIGDDYAIDYNGPLPTCTSSTNNIVVPNVEMALTEVGIQQLRQISVLLDSDVIYIYGCSYFSRSTKYH